jgi:hypothetical protein
MHYLYLSTITSYIFLIGPLCMLNAYHIIPIFNIPSPCRILPCISSSTCSRIIYLLIVRALMLLNPYLTSKDCSYLCDALPQFWYNFQFVCPYRKLKRLRLSGSSSLPLYASPGVRAWAISHVHPCSCPFNA